MIWNVDIVSICLCHCRISALLVVKFQARDNITVRSVCYGDLHVFGIAGMLCSIYRNRNIFLFMFAVAALAQETHFWYITSVCMYERV